MKERPIEIIMSKYLDTYYNNLETLKSKQTKARMLYKRKGDDLPFFSLENKTMHINPILVDQISTTFSLDKEVCINNLAKWASEKYNLGTIKPNLLVRESKCGCKASIKTKLV